jgi:hypothetical protein
LAPGGEAPTLDAVIGGIAKRLLNGAVTLVALVAFFSVPLGRKTLAQHLVAIFSTPPAREAASACVEAGRLVTARAAAEIGALRRGHDKPAPSPPREAEPPDAD